MEIEYKRKRTLNHRAERAWGYRSNLLMMDIKYDFKANPFKEKDGKPVLYPAVVVKETITTDHIVKELSKHSAYSAGCVVGVLQEVADMVVSHLRQGKNVRLDGLGTFSLALSSREVTDRKEIRGIREDKEGELPSGAGTGEAGAAENRHPPCRVRLLAYGEKA